MGSEPHGGARDSGEHRLRSGGGEVGGAGTPPEMRKESGAQGRPEQRPGAGPLVGQGCRPPGSWARGGKSGFLPALTLKPE